MKPVLNAQLSTTLGLLASLFCLVSLPAWAQTVGQSAAQSTAETAPAASAATSVATQTQTTPQAPLDAPPEVSPPAPPPPPRGRLDPSQDAARADLWQRVRNGFVMPDVAGELVNKWEQYYATRPDYVQRMTERGGRYLFHITEEVEKRGMPLELALLPFTESAFNPQAMSTARASGMWQFMPGTGKDFDLRQNLFRDDRRNVLASTRAALDYLQRLHKQFGDWHLALAAYNWGQGNVQRAIDRNRAKGLGTQYEALDMPAETRNYVPKLQAVKNIVLDSQRLGLRLPQLENHPYFLSVAIERDIDVALLSRLAGVSVEEFAQLNPQLNKPVLLAAGTPQVLLPYDNANRFVRELAAARGPLATWTAWVAPRTLKPADAARQVGMSEEQLREVNRIPARMMVTAGSTLLVPRSASSTTDVSMRVADNASMALTPEPKPVRKQVLKAGKKGETVAAIAQRYRVTPAQLQQWNPSVNASGGKFKAGQAIVLMLPASGAGAAAAPAKTSRGAKVVAAPAGKAAKVGNTAGAKNKQKPAAKSANKPANKAKAPSPVRKPKEKAR
jgi:membrane-bound lytic murein transglycosylase D